MLLLVLLSTQPTLTRARARTTGQADDAAASDNGMPEPKFDSKDLYEVINDGVVTSSMAL